MKKFLTTTLKTFAVLALFGAGTLFADAASFDPQPDSSVNYGFATINTNCSDDCANERNSISFNELPNNGEFTVYLDFRNRTAGTITNARGKVTLPTANGSSTATIIGQLSGGGASSISDNVTITNLPSDWEIEFVQGMVRVREHYSNLGNSCTDTTPGTYPWENSFSNYSSIAIGDLHDWNNGWCDQGYVFAKFRITDTTVNNPETEVETRNPSSITTNSAVLNGRLTSGNDVNVWFVFGTTPNVYCSTTAPFNVSGSYDQGENFSRNKTGLNADTHYYYRACAEDGAQGGLEDFYTEEVSTSYTYDWWTGEYGQCVNGVKERDVECRQYPGGIEVSTSNCSGAMPSSTSTSGCSTSGGDDLDVATNNATNIGSTSAKLHGEITSGDTSSVWFVYDTNNNIECSDYPRHYGSFSGSYPLNGGDEFYFNAPNLSLTENTEYFFRACAQEIGSSQIVSGELKDFTTDGGQSNNDSEPNAETKNPDNVDEDSAELNGRIRMNDFDNGIVFFVYGQDQSQIQDTETDYDSYGDVNSNEDDDDFMVVRVDSDNDEDGWRNYDETVSSLEEDERYYYRICVEYNDSGDTLECGSVEDFTTDDDDSNNNNNDDVEIATLLPRSVTQTTAEMCGDLEEDGGSSQQTWIEFRTGNANYAQTPVSQRREGSWCTRVSGLTANTTYLYRACTPYGCAPTRSLRTLGNVVTSGLQPIITTENPANVGSNSATLNGVYVSNAPSGTCWFNYGRTSALGKQTRSYNVGSGYGTCTHNFTGLASGTPYCVQAAIRTQNGTDVGDIKCFNTGRGTIVISQPPVTVVEVEGPEFDLSSLGLGLSLVRLEIDNNQEVVTEGERIEYVVEWQNISELDLTDLDLKVTLPPEIQVTDYSRGRFDAERNVIYYTIDELEGADFERDIPGEDGELTITGIVGDINVGNLVTAEAELSYDNPVNEAKESAVDFDVDEAGLQLAGVTASVFGLANITFLGWLVILLGLFIIFLVARWLYLEREELRAQAYAGGGYPPYGGAPRYDNGYNMPQYREPARFDAPQAPMAQAPQDDYYQPYRPNRG
jgi:hypothetical protein